MNRFAWRCAVLFATLALACDVASTGGDPVGPGPDASDPDASLAENGTPDLPVDPDAADLPGELPATDVSPADPGSGDASGDPAVELPADLPATELPPTDPGSGDTPADPANELPADLPGDLPATELPPGDAGPDAPPQAAPYLLIVSQDDLQDVADEWAAYRRAGGFDVQVVTVTELAGSAPDGPAFKVAVLARLREIRDTHASDTRLFLLLLGDAPSEGDAEAGRIPAHDCLNTTPGASGCWTDNRYGDLDDDSIPEVALGRVPARTVAEARTVLGKVQDFETHYTVGEWNRRVGLYVGQAGFSAEIDGMLELAMMEGLKRVSHAFDILGAWDNPQSSYWYMPFEDKVLDLFNDGALMTVYVGHGTESSTQGLTTDQVAQIHCTHRRPFSMFFACYAGNYAAESDSLAETLAFKADGPVASFGSSDVSHPYGNAVLAYESQMKALEMRYETIGEVLVAIKRGMIENDDDFREFMDGAGALDPSCESPEQRAEILRQHNDMYNLLGDPATSMQYPRELAGFDAPTGSIASRRLEVSGTTPGVGTGTAIVTLETERDVVVGTLATIDAKHPKASDVNANWAKSNDKAVARVEVPVTGGRFQATLDWTVDLIDGADYYLKVYAGDGTTDVLGVADFN